VNRRNFLQMLGLVVPAAAVAPDLARRYFFAPRGGWLLAKSGPPYTFSNGVYSLGGLTSLCIEKKSQVDFNGKTYKVPASFYGCQPHLVATGKLLDDLADVGKLQRTQWETDAVFRMRVIDKLEALHGQTWVS